MRALRIFAMTKAHLQPMSKEDRAFWAGRARASAEAAARRDRARAEKAFRQHLAAVADAMANRPPAATSASSPPDARSAPHPGVVEVGTGTTGDQK